MQVALAWARRSARRAWPAPGPAPPYRELNLAGESGAGFVAPPPSQMTMGIGHGSRPADDVVESSAYRPPGRAWTFGALCTRAGPLRRAPCAVGRYSDHRRL